MPDTPTSTPIAPVLIAGGGPAGLATAAELAHHGVRSILVEPRAAVSHARPRAKTTSARTMEIFRRWGVADTVREAAPLKPEWCRTVVFCSTLDGELITRFDDAFGMRAGPSDLFAEGGQQVPQPVVEEVLRAHLHRTGLVEFRLGERVARLTESSDSVSCEIARGDGSTYRLAVPYVAGCDGARGVTRDAIGSTLVGASATRSNLNTVFRAPGLRPAIGEAIQYWVIGPEVKATMGRLDREGTWWAGLGGIDATCSDERTVELIAALTGQPATEVGIELLATDPWVPRMLIADRWASDRVFLVGESAHVNPPYGGHGFNTCVGDAVNIGWKLAAVLQGWAGPGLLGTYEEERRDVAQQTIDSATRNFAASGPDIARTAEGLQESKYEEFNSLGLVLGYSYHSSSAVIANDEPPPFDVVSYTPSTLPGSRLPHAWIEAGHALYDDLGRGFTLIRPHGSPPGAVAVFEAEAETLRMPLTVIRAPRDWAHEPYILVRPDQHIAWRGADADASVLRRVIGTTRRTDSVETPIRPRSVDDLRSYIGIDIGPTEWHEVTQERVDAFAEATDDRQWIHVDPVRAAESPLGTTIAHGLYSLSRGPAFSYALMCLEAFAHSLNYGYDKVRFPAPLTVGSRLRMTMRITSVDVVAGGLQLRALHTFEQEGGAKPVCVAESLARIVVADRGAGHP